MSFALKDDLPIIAMKVERTYRAPRRWTANGCDIRNAEQLEAHLRLCNARRITKATARELGRTGSQVVTQAKKAAFRRNGSRPRKAIKNLSLPDTPDSQAKPSVTTDNSQRYK